MSNSRILSKVPSDLANTANGTLLSVENGEIVWQQNYAWDAANTSNLNAANASFLTTGTVPNARLSNIPNSSLANSSVTINGTGISLGGSGTVTANAATLTGTNLNSTVTGSSLTSVGTLSSLSVSGTTSLANVSYTGTLTSLVSTGTPPLTVSSTTKVENLNVDLLDGYNTATSNTANTVVVRDANSFISLNGLYMNSSEGLKNISWNNTYSTYDMELLNGVTLQVGQESHIYGRATETIQNGKIVMFAGAQGDGLLLQLANTQVTGFQPNWIVGVATQTITENDWGYVTWFGKVNDVDTYNYSLGDILYLDNNNPGAFSNTRPTAPDYAITLAAVVRVSNSPSSNNGILMVRPDFGYELSEAHDVNITNISANDVIIWSANNRWENKPQSNLDVGNSDKLDGEHGSYYTGYTDTANTNNLIYTNNVINSNVTLLQGINTTQNTNITNLTSWLNSNNTLQSGINLNQNTSIATIQGVDNTQNTSIAVIQGVDNTQNTRLTVIEGTDATQNTNITNLTSWLNSNNTLQTNINATQNTSITAAFIQANSAYNQANTANTNASNASNLTTGTIPGDRGVTAGSTTPSFIEYNGTTKTAGQFDGGSTAPTNTTRLNYDGNLYATSGNFTNVAYTGTLTGGTGVIAIGSNQIYKDSSGNVGIGTSLPGAKLDVYAGNNATSLRISNPTAGTAASPNYAELLFGVQIASPSQGYSSFIRSYNSGIQNYNSYLTFGTSNTNSSPTERLRIDSSGNVGIGTSSPSYKLDVNGTAKANTLALTANTASTNTTTGTLIVTGGVGISGALNATTKSFDIVHPSDPNKRLRYGSLESPYHGVRLTGKGKVINGKGVVSLPYYFRDLVHEEDVNIQLTNIKHGKVLWVEDINIKENEFTVGIDETTSIFTKEYEFFWDVTAERKDVPSLIVEE
nr:MAG: hypothetical protein [Caudoviricetes sp.]